jgi:hypothetical protein
MLEAVDIRALLRTIVPAKAKYLRKRRIVASVVDDRIGNICGGIPRGDLTDAVLRLDDDRDGCDQIPVDMMRDQQGLFSQKGQGNCRLWCLRAKCRAAFSQREKRAELPRFIGPTRGHFGIRPPGPACEAVFDFR